MRYKRLKIVEIESSDEIKMQEARGDIFGKLLKMNEDEFKNKMNNEEVDEVALEKMKEKFIKLDKIQNQKLKENKDYNMLKNLPTELKCEQTYLWC